MGRKYTKEMHEEYRRTEDERIAKEEQARRERTEKETTRRGFIREGGTSEQFERAWPELRDRARHQRALDRDRAAREAQRAQSGSRI
jgi:hypothetical protein